MSESLDWNRARSFLWVRYGTGRILSITQPATASGIWYAKIAMADGTVSRIEFGKLKKGLRRWHVIRVLGPPTKEGEGAL